MDSPEAIVRADLEHLERRANSNNPHHPATQSNKDRSNDISPPKASSSSTDPASSESSQANCTTCKDLTIIGLFGPPGSGKGTQCARLARRFLLEHLSIGDILRAEMVRHGSPYADIIRQNMALGRVGPSEITVEALKRRIEDAAAQGISTFVLDGFPRNVEQCEDFETRVAKLSCVVVLHCSDDTVLQRLTGRARWDDVDVENVRKRMQTFREVTPKVLAVFSEANKVLNVDAEDVPDEIELQLHAALRNVLQNVPGRVDPDEVCWKSVSGGVIDGDENHKFYRYGGMWKNKHEAVSAKKPKGVGKKKRTETEGLQSGGGNVDQGEAIENADENGKESE